MYNISLSAFQWRDCHGEFHSPTEMETRHLFFTLKMIWNHSAPEHMKLKPYKKYSFGPGYTAEYMRKAVKALSAELKTRNNIELYLHQLKQIQTRLKELNNDHSRRCKKIQK